MSFGCEEDRLDIQSETSNNSEKPVSAAGKDYKLVTEIQEVVQEALEEEITNQAL